jgi:hypothetical protein
MGRRDGGNGSICGVAIRRDDRARIRPHMTAATAAIRAAGRVRRARSIGLLSVLFTLTFSAATRAQGLAEPHGNQGRPEPHVNQRPPEPARTERTDIQGAIVGSLNLLMIEHGARVMFQEKTRRELRGPFFEDYRRSIRWPDKWHDGDSWHVNYVGHTVHGAAAGRIWLDHGPARNTPPTASGYWPSRARMAAFSALYSLQFEFGPVSEASIGNVGMRPETSGWVDHVMTPAGAFAFVVVEDVLDRYFVAWVERQTANRIFRASVRALFNPSRVLSNLAQRRAPWSRLERPLSE